MLKISTNILKSFRSGTDWVKQNDPQRRIKSPSHEVHVKPFYLEWLNIQPLLESVHGLSLSKDENESVLLKIYDTLHMEMLDETLHHIPHDRHQEFLQHVKEENDPSKLFAQYGVNHRDIQDALVKRGENVIGNLQIALKKDM